MKIAVHIIFFLKVKLLTSFVGDPNKPAPEEKFEGYISIQKGNREYQGADSKLHDKWVGYYKTREWDPPKERVLKVQWLLDLESLTTVVHSHLQKKSTKQ